MYCKAMPWFVSDATKSDFYWLLEQLNQSTASPLWQSTYQRWQQHLRNGQWILQTHSFFTLAYDFAQMREISPELYSSMSQSKLLIFKGDLNYRKLVGDLEWSLQERFEVALRGFYPAPLVALRTCKADVQVELDEKLVKQVSKIDPRWLVNGRWGVIQTLIKTDSNPI